MLKRISFLALSLIAMGLLLTGQTTKVAAQDAIHPIVGTWLANTNAGFGGTSQDVFMFTADGGYIEVDADQAVNLGAWEATGDNTAILTIVVTEGDDEGNDLGATVVRAEITVSDDGESFEATFTLEIIGPDGSTTGEVGPGTAVGTRISVEGPGEPVMTFDELIALFEGEEEGSSGDDGESEDEVDEVDDATPEATPVS